MKMDYAQKPVYGESAFLESRPCLPASLLAQGCYGG